MLEMNRYKYVNLSIYKDKKECKKALRGSKGFDIFMSFFFGLLVFFVFIKLLELLIKVSLSAFPLIFSGILTVFCVLMGFILIWFLFIFVTKVKLFVNNTNMTSIAVNVNDIGVTDNGIGFIICQDENTKEKYILCLKNHEKKSIATFMCYFVNELNWVCKDTKIKVYYNTKMKDTCYICMDDMTVLENIGKVERK